MDKTLKADHLSGHPLEAKVHALRVKSNLKGPHEVISRPPGHGATRPIASAPDTWRFPKPAVDEFFVTDEVWEQLCFVASRGTNVLLTGPSGCGKSELCYRIARAASRPIEPFNCGAMSEPRSSLIGNTHFDRQKGTWFAESRFVRSVQKTGTCVLLDEISRAGRDAFNILLPLLDAQGYLALDEAEGAAVVKRAEHVTFFATANFGMEYTGAEPLDKALADRFPVVIAIDFPPRERGLALLIRRCPGLSERAAARLVAVAVRQRELMGEGEFMGPVSTRSLLAAGEQVAAGMPIENALRFCILNRFSAEGGDVSERAKLLQIVQRINE